MVEPSDVRCLKCGALEGEPCSTIPEDMSPDASHFLRILFLRILAEEV
jgi:hypothetical protein